jgi:hypothetical protein
MRRSSWAFVVVAVLVAVGACVFAWYVLKEPRGHQETATVPVIDAGVAAVVDAGPPPSVDDGDSLLKKLAAGWSSDELFAKWLAATSLRHLVAAVQAVADGQSPRASLPFVSITGSFAVREEPLPEAKTKPAKKKRKTPPPPGHVFISPASYTRYDLPTHALTSVPPAAAGAAYAELRPFLDAVFAEVGRPGQHFDDVFTAALRRLTGVTLPEGEVEVVPKGLAWAFKDESLEALTPAEKHVVRMGPENGRALQAWLRSFAESAQLLPPR